MGARPGADGDERGCLQTAVGWVLEGTLPGGDQSQVRLSPGQALPELAQQRPLLASALPAGRGAPSARSPGVNPAVRSENVGAPGPRNVPKRRVSALPVATCSPNFALYTQDTD